MISFISGPGHSWQQLLCAHGINGVYWMATGTIRRFIACIFVTPGGISCISHRVVTHYTDEACHVIAATNADLMNMCPPWDISMAQWTDHHPVMAEYSIV